VWKYAGWEGILKLVAERSGEDLFNSARDRAKLVQTGRLQDDFTMIVFQSSSP
jgi:hypothetical protein